MSTVKINVCGKYQFLRQKPRSAAKQVHMQVRMLSRVIELNNCAKKELPCLVSVFPFHDVFVLHIPIVTKR